jgi:DNA polymerase-3 subunit gamma/tau
MFNLALKYRPKLFEDIVSQKEIVDILKYQLENKTTKNSYLFSGASGCGKTTTARIFANQINQGKGQAYEIDAASNTGVDNVRKIIEQAHFKSIDSEYKVFIIDECHMLSLGAWNALLKVLEEPPQHSVFILCTTDPQKVIPTVLSRVQRFDFTRIPTTAIVERLVRIVDFEVKEGKQIKYTRDAIQVIAEQAKGGLRTAISLLDKALAYTQDLTYDLTCKALGIMNKQDLDTITDYIFNNQQGDLLKAINDIYMDGKDLKQFIKQWIERTLIKQKEVIMGKIKTPNGNYIALLDVLLNINNGIKYEDNPKDLIEAELLLFLSNYVNQ